MTLWKIFITFLSLGFTSFGGPTAHIGFFREKFVERMKIIDDMRFTHLLSITQALPGPTSSQLALAIGLQQGGIISGHLALLAFSLPSTFIMIAFALFISNDLVVLSSLTIIGLSSISIPIVGKAVYSMFKMFCNDNLDKIGFIIFSGILIFTNLLLYPIAILLIGWIYGVLSTNDTVKGPNFSNQLKIGNSIHSILCLFILVILLIFSNVISLEGVPAICRDFFNMSFLVFGGGHVVLPLLEGVVVQNGFISSEDFMLGYGMAQAIPGPLFSFAAYLGALLGDVSDQKKLLYSLILLISLYGSTLLLVAPAINFWNVLQRHRIFLRGIRGVNVAVTSILFVSFLAFVIPSIATSETSIILILISFILIFYLRMSPWLSLIFLGLMGACFTQLKHYGLDLNTLTNII